MDILPFKPRRFRSAAAYYARYRIPYPPELIARVAREANLSPGDRVLDLGCGPAMLGIAVAQLGASVMAVDPEPEMLDEARAQAEFAGVDIDIRQGSSYDLPPDLGELKLVVMGRSFHWMDRVETLRTLDRLVLPQGRIALLHDHLEAADPDWRSAANEIITTFIPDALGQNHARPGWVRHQSVLIDSVFSSIDSIGRICRRKLTADDIVGRVFSMSVSSPDVFGERAEAFETALREKLAALAPDGQFSELVEVSALVAGRA